MKFVWLLGLTLAAWEDIRYRQVSFLVLLIIGIPGLWNLYEAWSMGWLQFRWHLAAAGVGAVMLILSKVTRGALGDGDGLFFLVTACYLNLGDILVLFLGSLGIACVWGTVLLWRRCRRATIPLLACAWPVGLMVICR